MFTFLTSLPLERTQRMTSDALAVRVDQIFIMLGVNLIIVLMLGSVVAFLAFQTYQMRKELDEYEYTTEDEEGAGYDEDEDWEEQEEWYPKEDDYGSNNLG